MSELPKCEICGKTVPPRRRGVRKYCSAKCARKGQRLREKERRENRLGSVSADDAKYYDCTLARIKASKRHIPIVSGWRGQRVMGGGAMSIGRVKGGADK